MADFPSGRRPEGVPRSTRSPSRAKRNIAGPSPTSARPNSILTTRSWCSAAGRSVAKAAAWHSYSGNLSEWAKDGRHTLESITRLPRTLEHRGERIRRLSRQKTASTQHRSGELDDDGVRRRFAQGQLRPPAAARSLGVLRRSASASRWQSAPRGCSRIRTASRWPACTPRTCCPTIIRIREVRLSHLETAVKLVYASAYLSSGRGLYLEAIGARSRRVPHGGDRPGSGRAAGTAGISTRPSPAWRSPTIITLCSR